jgi:hypothetical protein
LNLFYLVALKIAAISAGERARLAPVRSRARPPEAGESKGPLAPLEVKKRQRRLPMQNRIGFLTGLARLLLTRLINADFGEGIQNSINLILRKRGRSDLNKRNKIKGAKRPNVQFSTRTVLIPNSISCRVALKIAEISDGDNAL